MAFKKIIRSAELIQPPEQVLVIGGSGGVGGAILRVIAARYPQCRLHGTWCRNERDLGSDVIWHRVDATCEDQTQELAAAIDGRVDWIINTVGLLHRDDKWPEKSLGRIDNGYFLECMRVNVLPTLNLAKAFKAKLAPSASVFAGLSARVGSIEDNSLGGWYSYRCSKAALNMALKTISIEWKRTLPGCCVAALHPGTVDTDLSAPFQSNVPDGSLFTSEQSANYLINVIESLSAEKTGQFWAWDGSNIPW